MNKDPIDFDSPLGISKREWTKVLGVNLALLLIVYTVTLICTLCGNKLFLLNFQSNDLQRIEDTLRSFGIYPIVQILFCVVENTIMSLYIAKRKIYFWIPIVFFAVYVAANLAFTYGLGYYPGYIVTIINVLFIGTIALISIFKWKEKWYVILLRTAIALAVSFLLNEAIALFRIKVGELLYTNISASVYLALTIEYDLAIALALGFLTLIIPWKKGEKEPCLTNPVAGGCSPTTTNSLPKNSKIAKNSLPPKIKKRLRLLKIKVITIQTVALIVIAALPWFAGRPIEFALVYASFCSVRFVLGFNHSLHFKSELMCVTIGALCFWGLVFLTPDAKVSIIMSLVYGAGLALGFRLYWELHDLLMYRKAAKTDRYAMLYVVFKGNADPKHVNGYMRMKGYSDKDNIKMVQMYMAKDKVEYIAEWMGYAKITVEKRLTDIANDLYQRR